MPRGGKGNKRPSESASDKNLQSEVKQAKTRSRSRSQSSRETVANKQKTEKISKRGTKQQNKNASAAPIINNVVTETRFSSSEFEEIDFSNLTDQGAKGDGICVTVDNFNEDDEVDFDF